MRYLYIILAMAVLSGIAAAGSFGAKLDTDTYVDSENPDDTFDEEELLWASSADGEPLKEAYIGFINVFGAQGIFNPKNIEEATLNIYATEVDEPGEVTAYLFKGATLSSLTWNDKEDYEDEPSVTFDVDEAGKVSVDVTDLVQKAVEICTEGCPYSIVLVAKDNASVGFASSESDDEPVLKYTT